MMAGAWVMVVISRPYTWWKLVMIAACGTAACLVIFVVPSWRPAWAPLASAIAQLQLDPSNAALMASGVWLGVAGAVVIEAIWWLSGHLGGEHRSLFGRKPA